MLALKLDRFFFFKKKIKIIYYLACIFWYFSFLDSFICTKRKIKKNTQVFIIIIIYKVLFVGKKKKKKKSTESWEYSHQWVHNKKRCQIYIFLPPHSGCIIVHNNFATMQMTILFSLFSLPLYSTFHNLSLPLFLFSSFFIPLKSAHSRWLCLSYIILDRWSVIVLVSCGS